MAKKKTIEGEYRGLKYTIGPRDPFPGIGWTIILQTYDGPKKRQSGGAFYDGVDEHPEGAYAWAESSCKAAIDRMSSTFCKPDAPAIGETAEITTTRDMSRETSSIEDARAKLAAMFPDARWTYVSHHDGEPTIADDGSVTTPRTFTFGRTR